MPGYTREIDTIKKDHQAAELRVLGLTYQQIGDRLGYSRQAAYQAVERAIADIPRMATEELRTIELEKLDDLERKLRMILQRKHYKVSASGKVVYDSTGEPVTDSGPEIQAIMGILKVIDKRAKLLGLDAPVKTQTEVTVYDGTGEVERELYERALAWRQWQADNGGEGDRSALPMGCLLYTSPSPRDGLLSRMPSSA